MTLRDWLFHRRQREEELDEEVQSSSAHGRAGPHGARRIRRAGPHFSRPRVRQRHLGQGSDARHVGLWLARNLAARPALWRAYVAKNPGFTLLVTGLLALGIGATTVIFSLFDAVFLRPLPVRHPGELVRMVEQYLPRIRTQSNFRYAYYEALHEPCHNSCGHIRRDRQGLPLRDE